MKVRLETLLFLRAAVCLIPILLLPQSKLLQFATGAARIPLTGFRDLRGGGEPRLFKITRVGTKMSLPQAHSCFNRLDLPPYESLDVLKEKLTMA